MINVGKTLDFNEIIWVGSTADDSKNFMGRVAEDVSSLCASQNFTFTKINVSTIKDFENSLNEIARQCLVTRGCPLIHLDFHGDMSDGLKINSSEMYSWSGLRTRLRTINEVTENRLVVFGAACEAMWGIKGISIHEPTPFYLYIAPETTITNRELEAAIPEFYKHILNCGDAMQSFNLASRHVDITTKLRLFHCERMAAISIAQYIKSQCMGKGRADRINYLLDMLKPSPSEVSASRREAKQFLRPSERLLDTWKIFFHNQTPSFTIADIESLLDDDV